MGVLYIKISKVWNLIFFLCFLLRRATYWYGFIMLLIGFVMATVLPDVKMAEKNNNIIAMGSGKEHQY